MKKQLKILSLVLSIALLLISAAPFPVNAFDSIDMDDNAELITPSSNAIYSILATDASFELCKALSDMNVSIQSNTLIEVVPLEGGTGGTAIEITNTVNNTITKDIFVAPQSNGTFANLAIASPDTASINDTGTVYIPGYSDALVHATATFDRYPDSMFRPRSIQIIYYSNGVNVVTNVDVQYICEGYVWSYPELEDLSEDDYDVYRHVILIFKTAPESGVPYSFSRPYRSDRVIQAPGILTTSHHIEFSVYIDGVRIQNTVDIR